MEYGKKYEVIAEMNGFFSNQHQPNVESNKCILWLTDASVYTQPIQMNIPLKVQCLLGVVQLVLTIYVLTPITRARQILSTHITSESMKHN